MSFFHRILNDPAKCRYPVGKNEALGHACKTKFFLEKNNQLHKCKNIDRHIKKESRT